MRCPCGSVRTSWNGKDGLWECSACATAFPAKKRLLAKDDDEEAGWNYASPDKE
jgi:hypothetical protein